MTYITTHSVSELPCYFNVDCVYMWGDISPKPHNKRLTASNFCQGSGYQYSLLYGFASHLSNALAWGGWIGLTDANQACEYDVFVYMADLIGMPWEVCFNYIRWLHNTLITVLLVPFPSQSVDFFFSSCSFFFLNSIAKGRKLLLPANRSLNLLRFAYLTCLCQKQIC